MQIDSKALKAVAAGASKELGRYAINGVLLDSDGSIVTTDWRMLLMAKGKLDDGETVTPRTLALEAVETVLRDPLVRRFKRAQMASNGHVSYVGGTGDIPVNVPLAEISKEEAEFPDYRGVLRASRGEAAFRVTLGTTLLAKIAKAAAAADANGVTMEFNVGSDGKPDPLGSVLLAIGENVSGVMMPQPQHTI